MGIHFFRGAQGYKDQGMAEIDCETEEVWTVKKALEIKRIRNL